MPLSAPRFVLARHPDLIALLILTIGAAALRFSTLDVQSFDHDETVTAAKVLLPSLHDTLHVVKDSERSPPLYYVLGWLWSKLFGTGEVGLRSLSALIGTLTVPAAWIAGRELCSARAGCLAAALVAVNPYLIWYSQEARSYALMVLMTTIAIAFFARTLRRPSGVSLSLWAVSAGLAVWSHYFAAFIVGPMVLWLAWVAVRGTPRWLLAPGAVVLVGIALLPLAHAQEGEGRRNGFTLEPISSRAVEVATNYSSGEEPSLLHGSVAIDALQLISGSIAALSLAGALVAVGKTGDQRKRRAARIVGLLVATAIGLPFVLALLGLDYANPRNLISGLVPLLLLGAVGFEAKRHLRLATATAALVLTAFLSSAIASNLTPQMQRVDYRAAADAIGQAGEDRILVAGPNGDTPLVYYLGAQRFDSPEFSSGVFTHEIVALTATSRVAAPRGFRLAEHQTVNRDFELWRFVSAREVLVVPADVGSSAVVPSPRSIAMLQRPG